ncbi:MAG: hypothetical protein BWY17_00836 [Deltaproteobacteria bacterium ADurb.Bin207]|jgi:hypothetical protein|nr:MAG: hypothetical protein BWY17_00836 [Deltaproteobacteria bacterium ADurb.Bin207]
MEFRTPQLPAIPWKLQSLKQWASEEPFHSYVEVQSPSTLPSPFERSSGHRWDWPSQTTRARLHEHPIATNRATLAA